MRRRPPAAVRRIALVAVAFSLVSSAADVATARDGRDDSSAGLAGGLVSTAQRRATDRALAWIAHNQQSGGFWGEEDDTKVADTALSLLALMAGGNTVSSGGRLNPGDENDQAVGAERLRGPYAEHVKEGLRYLSTLATNPDNPRVPGYITDDQKSRMHGHGFATLALATASGNLGGRDYETIKEDVKRIGAVRLSLPDRVRYALHAAVRVIENAQDSSTGGWFYEPVPTSHEGSMTVTQIHALRAAQDAGVKINGKVLREAYEYVRESQNRSNRDLFGGFAYMKTRKGRVTYPLTAAALTTFFGLGRYGGQPGDRDVIRDGMNYLDRNFEDALAAEQWFYYGLFYGAQAIYQEHDSQRLSRQWPRIRDRVLAEQRSDGSFSRVGHDGRSREYCSAMGCLILQVPTETLPIFQRR